MKAAPKIIFLFEDADGLGASLCDALQLTPSSSALRRSDDAFELPLKRYGIQDRKASGKFVHFIDDKGLYQVSLLLLQHYEPPILACALNEVLVSIKGGNSSSMPSILLPCIVSSSKLKLESNSTVDVSKVSLYGFQICPNGNIDGSFITGLLKPPSSLQIHYEPIACFLQLVSVLKIPTFVLIGQGGQHLFSTLSVEEFKVHYGIGELLASAAGLSFMRDKFAWSPMDKSRNAEEPWRAIYG